MTGATNGSGGYAVPGAYGSGGGFEIWVDSHLIILVANSLSLFGSRVETGS